MSKNSTTDGELEAEERNGVYLLEIESEYAGYSVKSATDRVLVENVTINGNYVGPSPAFETECNDYKIEGDTLHLVYDPRDSCQSK
jgi:hypothetical protein